MLSTVKGTVIGCREGKLQLEVGAFALAVSVPASFSVPLGSFVKLYTSLFIREENLVLYGFATETEQSFFHLALSVQGVGPKLAMSLLGSMPFPELIDCLKSGNAKALKKVNGVGEKTAERLVAELKGKVRSYSPDAKPPKGKAVEVLVDLGLESSKAWEAVESISGDDHSVNELVNLSLEKLGKL